MFDFETSKLSEEKIKEIANNTNQSFLKVAIKANGHKWSQKYWPEIVDVVDLSIDEYVTFDKILRLGKTKKGVIGFSTLYESLRKIKPFAGRSGVVSNIKGAIIPTLESHGFICFIDDRTYVNPFIIDAQGPELFAKKTKPGKSCHDRYTEEEIEEAIELLRMMRKITEALK